MEVSKGLTIIFLIVLVPVIIALFFLFRFLYRNTVGKKYQTTLMEDFRNEADAFERAGKYVSAAHIYENKLKDPRKAAALYEKGNDFSHAASLYDLLDMAAKAKEMYEKAGKIDDAAEVSIREGEYEEAAKLYDKAGKKTDAALIMERAGRKMAAIRAYREAGDYRNASRLLEEEGMAREAAEMFGLSLAGKTPDQSSVQDFYTFGFKLEKSGQTEKALEIYRRIDQAMPTYKDVRERMQALAPEQKEEEIDMEGKTSIRNFIRSGKMEPKYGLKLWLQILKKLEESYLQKRPYGFICPENILVDSQNNIYFLRKGPSAAYTPPEKQKDIALDERSDIFSMGVILYEMLTGGLDGLGSTRVMDIVGDVPDWLDEIVIKCIRKVREDRYQNIEDIFTDIKTLSKARKSGEGAS